MESDEIDFDRHPEIVRAALLQAARLNADHLRRWALEVRKTPHITAERALNDAAEAIERGVLEWLAKLGSADNTSQH